MRTRLFVKCSSLLAIVLMVHISIAPALAAEDPPKGMYIKDSDEPRLAVRVFEANMKEPLEGVPSRIVSVSTGQAKDGETNQRGCHDFEEVEIGSYSLSVNYENKDYLLPEKVKVGEKQKILVCVALVENGTLALVADKKCECKEFPFLWLIFGGAAAGAGIIPVGGGDDEEVSPSRP